MAAVIQSGSFVFLAATAAGRRSLGVRSALSERALAEQLRRERLLLLKSWRLPKWLATQDRGLGLKDRAELNDQLAQLLSRGVPLVEALEVTSQTVAPAARGKVEQMREAVAAGSSFADAGLKAGAFDKVTIAVYRAAERSGDLAGAAKQLAVTARRQLGVQSKAATLMIYPCIVLSISIVVAFVMLTLLVPRIGESLRSLAGGNGQELPWFTELVVGVGEFLRRNILIVLGVVGCLVVGSIMLRKQVGAALARVARRTPILRDVVLAQESTRFFSTLASMTRSGVPLADALGTANEAVGHPAMRRQLTTLRTKLIEGGMLRVLIEQVTALPLATRRLLIAAERAGDMDTAFDSLAADMADEVDKRSSRLLAALEPTLIVLMFMMIGTLIISLMIPIIRMSDVVQ